MKTATGLAALAVSIVLGAIVGCSRDHNEQVVVPDKRIPLEEVDKEVLRKLQPELAADHDS